jgi:hypothetical protein
VPVTAAQILFYESAGADSSGGVISVIQIDKTKISRLFSDTTREGIADGEVTYRKVFIKNTNPDLALLTAFIYLLSQPSDLERIAFALGTEDDTDPTGLTFEETSGRGAAFLLGDIGNGVGEEKPLWIRRTTPAATPEFEQAMFQVVVEGQTSP